MILRLDQCYGLLQIDLSSKIIVFSKLGNRNQVSGQLQQSY